jgi:transcriptional regulator with GAF, ATPase, and Fis domain
VTRSIEDDPAESQSKATATYYRGAPTASPLGAIVRVLGKKATPSTFRLTSGTCVVGSAPPCDIIIDEPTVSRMHAELNLVPAGVEVRDLGSRNGTFYLGQRVEKMTLALGGRLDIGAATIVVDADTGALEERVSFEGDSYRGIVGTSKATRRLFGLLSRLEGSLVTVLIDGESGVGKEVVARALHEGSQRSEGPLIIVNCGAIPRDLVASELFGHKKGAFTGAVDNRRGAFEAADGGTLFLDEIGELPLDVQPVLLRALESGEVRPVGGDHAHRVSVRVVAATNRDLEAEVAAGKFREDLFYRLAVVRLKIPPLRERIEDIEPLAAHFAASVGAGELPSDVLEKLKARTFPGNARELRNAIQAYGALGVLPEPTRQKTNMLDVGLREMIDLDRPYAAQKDALNDRFTKIYLEALLARTGGNQTSAARMAGLDRSYIGRLVAKYGLGKD